MASTLVLGWPLCWMADVEDATGPLLIELLPYWAIWLCGEKLNKVGKGLDLVQKDTQSINTKVEDLSKGKKEKAKIASMHESEGIYGRDNLSASSGGRRGSYTCLTAKSLHFWEIASHMNLSELLHQAIKVEMQLRRRSASRKICGGSSRWKGKEKEKDRASREKSLKKGSEASKGTRTYFYSCASYS
ncbi:hypothetical protein CR513_00480, partial [Mucuna pruriens]